VIDWGTIEHFSESEFTCHCGCGETAMEESFVRKLDNVRHDLGFPFVISSGYRCPEYNNQVSSTGLDGPHTTGKAADIVISGRNARRLLTAASQVFGGIGISQKGEWARRFIHVDDLDTRVWTY